MYPAYINSKKTVAEGRRIPKDKVSRHDDNYYTVGNRLEWEILVRAVYNLEQIIFRVEIVVSLIQGVPVSVTYIF